VEAEAWMVAEAKKEAKWKEREKLVQEAWEKRA
jgi:hypothetical protein